MSLMARKVAVCRGWRLTKQAWRLIRRDRSMLTLAIVSAALAAAVAVIVMWLSGALTHAHQNGRLAWRR